MKIKAAVVHSPGQDFVIEEVDLAPPKESEVLVRMVACGVCHSDAFARNGDTRAAAGRAGPRGCRNNRKVYPLSAV